jgi:hypothetical protein
MSHKLAIAMRDKPPDGKRKMSRMTNSSRGQT